MGGVRLLRTEAEADAPKAASSGQPVGMQVSEPELDEFSKRLSADCSGQFVAMLHGNGTVSALHTFQDSGPKEEASKQCKELHGGLCFTTAHLEEQVTHGGRTMTSQVDVEGNGCLPSQCVAEQDLQAWTNFMHSKVMEQLPGQAVTVRLDVDCRATGGATAVAGAAEGDSAETTQATRAANDAKKAATDAAEAAAKAKKAVEGASKAAEDAKQAAQKAKEAASNAKEAAAVN